MEFIKHIEQAGYRVGGNRAFCDFLTLAVCTLSAQEQEGQYLKVAKSYNAKEMNEFSYAFAEMIHEMDNGGIGLKDCLGDYFMEILGNEGKGQFFTPEPICDLMAGISQPKGGNFYDPCCGSGRLALSAAKINRGMKFYCADIDLQCCQMTLINMCLNGLFGTVEHCNSLLDEVWRRWVISRHPILLVPFIYEIDLLECQEAEIIPEIRQPEPEQRQLELFFDELNLL
jgi:hypothetical protein